MFWMTRLGQSIASFTVVIFSKVPATIIQKRLDPEEWLSVQFQVHTDESEGGMQSALLYLPMMWKNILSRMRVIYMQGSR